MSPKPEGRRRRGAAELWRVALSAVDGQSAEAAARALGEFDSVSAFKENLGPGWRVEGLTRAAPDRAQLVARLALAWLDLAGPPPEPRWERVKQADWLAVNQASFPPRTVGRYFIHPTHNRGRPPAGRIGLAIDAATAFGTGEHASTIGCLLALEAFGRPHRVLDIGTGTGILAIAAAKRWKLRVRACDIDREAVRVATCNLRCNGVAALVALSCSGSYRDRAVARGRPYDLVLANILARPLKLLARDLGTALAPGGAVVLAGLLPWQENSVLAAHRLQGLRLSQRLVVDGWSTLVLSRGRPAHFHPIRRRLTS